MPRPVNSSSPTNTRNPIPAASRPGSRATASIVPPSPATSSIRKVATMGDPSNVLIAAKLPAVAMMATAPGGASRFTVRIASAARPPPMAINGASGPSTAPSDSVANAARNTPGSSIGGVGPPCWNPPDGEWPEFPGRDWMHHATSSPDNANSGTGHQTGVVSNPNPPGRSSNRASWSQSTSTRNPYTTMATGMAISAASTSACRYSRDRTIESGSTGFSSSVIVPPRCRTSAEH